jgi:hypothetical protein
MASVRGILNIKSLNELSSEKTQGPPASGACGAAAACRYLGMRSGHQNPNKQT